MAKSSNNKKEEPIKFEGTFEDFIKKALEHEPMHNIKKKDRVVTKENPLEIYVVIEVNEGKVTAKKENSNEMLELNENDLLVIE